MTTSPPPDKDALRNAIAKDEAQLAALEQARQAAQARLDSLNAELASCQAEPAIRVRLPVLPPPAAPTTPLEKVALFR